MSSFAGSAPRDSHILTQVNFPGSHDLFDACALIKANSAIVKPTERLQAQNQLRCMRSDFTQGIDLYKANMPPSGGVWQDFRGFKMMSECHCVPALSREAGAPNARLLLENRVTALAQAIKNSGQIPHILALGTGLMGQELHLLRSLQKAGITQIKLDAVDLSYSDKEIHQSSSINQKNKLHFIREFTQAVSSGLNIRVTLDEKKTDHCQDINSLLKNELDQIDSKSTSTIDLRLFSSVDEFRQCMPKAGSKQVVSRPQIIYDIDMVFDRKERNTIVSPALNVSAKNTNYISIGKFADSLIDDLELETRVRSNGQWGPSQVFNIDKGEVAA